MVIYKPTTKAIKKKALDENCRLILHDGIALLFNTDGRIEQCDLLYSKPDSHLVATDEKLEQYKFSITSTELFHAQKNGVWLPTIRAVVKTSEELTKRDI